MKHVIALLILISSAMAEARSLSCQEALAISRRAGKSHVNSIEIDAAFVKKSAYTYLMEKDPQKNYLLASEFTALEEEISKNAETILKDLEANKCDFYYGINAKVKEGKARWVKLLEASINKENVQSSPEVDRGSQSVNFKTPEELSAYADYVTSVFVKLGVEAKKPLKKIKEEFKSKNLVEKKQTSTEESRTPDDIAQSFFKALDPHSDYIPQSISSEFQSSLSAQLEGVGLALDSHALGARISKVIPNGPAARSNAFKKNDVIIQVDSKIVADMDLRDIVKVITGKKGSKVTLHYMRGKDHKKITLVRESIKLEDSRVKTKLITFQEKTILLISMPSFYYDPKSQSGVANDLIAKYQESKKINPNIDGIILDLRYDGGGALDEAVRVAGVFLPSEPALVVQVKSRGIINRQFAKDSPFKITEPLIVLINKASASASEIVAGALKDHGRALIVGDPQTFGKGTVQSVSETLTRQELGLMKVTIAMFYTPSGSSTQLKGVSSDIVIPAETGLIDRGEESMKYAIEWSEVPNQVENKNKSLETLLPALKKKSAERIKSNKEFEKFVSREAFKKNSKEEEKNKTAKEKEDEQDADEETLFAKITDQEKDLTLKESLHITLDLINGLKKP